MIRRIGFSVLVASVLAGPAIFAQRSIAPRPWPEDDVLAARGTAAQNRKLFQDASVLELTLASDFSLINKERKPNKKTQFPGILTVQGADIPVTLGSRGHLRLNSKTCDFVPIRIAF